MSISEHEVMTFRRVLGGLECMANDGMPVKSTGALAEALGRLGCFPYAKVPCSFDLECELSIGDTPAGTFQKPNVDLILQKSTASPFGKGDTTILDPAYRNGKEITAQNMSIASQATYRYFSHTSEDEISAAMFVGNPVQLKFYKLAVYEEGGHFDWHMDTTHSDKHHATLLVALNTSWEGGDLMLRRNGIETSVDLHPKVDREGGIDLQAVAFFTDTEHKVQPVTKGIRIVLQYDVEVVGSNQVEDEDEDEEYDDNRRELCYNVEALSRKRKHYQVTSDSHTVDNAIVTEITKIIEDLLAKGDNEVVFAMQHLYRKSSILPEFLKGADAQLYRALISSFDVSLRPVILRSTSDYEGRVESIVAIPWDDVQAGHECDSDDENPRLKPKKYSDKPKVTFHLPMLSAIREISSQEYIEHTGNSAQPEDKKYFGGGMFVRQKQVAKE